MTCLYPNPNPNPHFKKSFIIYITGDYGVKASLTFNYSVLFRFNIVEQGVVDNKELIIFDTNHGEVAVEFRCTSDKNTDFTDADGYILVTDDDTSTGNIDKWCNKFNKTKSLILCRNSERLRVKNLPKIDEIKELKEDEIKETGEKYMINVPEVVTQFKWTVMYVQPADLSHMNIKDPFTKMLRQLTGKDDLCFV